MTKILFVCHGNICRSPMAEFCMRQLTERPGLAGRYEISSAATSAEEAGNGVYPPVRQLLRRHGISCDGKTARQMTPADYDRYDLLIGTETYNLRNMRRICGGDPAGKMHRLLDFTDHPGDIDDPWYTGDFDGAWRDVQAGCRALLERLEQAQKKSAHEV